MAPAQLSDVDAVTQLSFLVQGALLARADEDELSLVQVRLLGILRDRRPTMNELATLLELDKSSVTGLVARAERRGLVSRSPSPRDGRSTVVAPTSAGRRLIRSVSVRFAADVEALLAELPDRDRGALTSLASRIVVAEAHRRGVDLLAGTTSRARSV